MTITKEKERAMIEAHKAGRNHARTIGASRAYVNNVAHTMPVDEGDAFLAGYYGETRRMNTERQADAAARAADYPQSRA